MLIRVDKVEALDGSRLRVGFSDGASAELDLAPVLASGGPMVEPLRDESYFRRVFVDHGAPTWPNGFDLDPIALYSELVIGNASEIPEIVDATAGALLYRRSQNGDIWHFVPSCSSWPRLMFEERLGEPRAESICDECRAKFAAGRAVVKRVA
jgi:hypothetical protein